MNSSSKVLSKIANELGYFLKHTDTIIVYMEVKNQLNNNKIFCQSYRAFMLKIRTSSKQYGTYIKLLQKLKNLLPSPLKVSNRSCTIWCLLPAVKLDLIFQAVFDGLFTIFNFLMNTWNCENIIRTNSGEMKQKTDRLQGYLQ